MPPRPLPDDWLLAAARKLGLLNGEKERQVRAAVESLSSAGHPVPLEVLLPSVGALTADNVEAVRELLAASDFLCDGCGAKAAPDVALPSAGGACPRCRKPLRPTFERRRGSANASTVRLRGAGADRARASLDAGRGEDPPMAGAEDGTSALRNLSFPPPLTDVKGEWGARVGRTLGRYTLLEVLGLGGWGAVYLAEHDALRTRVALKVLAPDLARSAEHLDRFLSEARITAQLDHPGIRKTLDVGRDGSHHFLVLEYVDGVCLHTLVEANARLAPMLAARVTRRLAAILDHALGRGVVHRDMKPRNVLVSRKGEVKLTDFGIAKLMLSGAGGTQTGVVMGTPQFMSPEQFEGGRMDHRADIYSLGCTLYFLLTGRPPFDGADFATMLRLHRTAAPPSPLRFNPSIPPDLSRILSRMLAKRPEDRYGSYGNLLSDLAALEASVAPVPTPPAPERGATSVRRLDEERLKRCEEVRAIYRLEGMPQPPVWHVAMALGYARDDATPPDLAVSEGIEVACRECGAPIAMNEEMEPGALRCGACGSGDFEHPAFALVVHQCYARLTLPRKLAGDAEAHRDLVRAAAILSASGRYNLALDLSTCETLPETTVAALTALRSRMTVERIAPVLYVSERAASETPALAEFFILLPRKEAAEDLVDRGRLCPHLRFFLAAVRGQLQESRTGWIADARRSAACCVDRQPFSEFYRNAFGALQKLDPARAKSCSAALVKRLPRAGCLGVVGRRLGDVLQDAVRAALEKAAAGALGEGRNRRARQLAEAVLAEYPGSGAANEIVGQVLLREGRPAEAARHFARAADAGDSPAESWMNEASAHLKAGERERAVASLDRILAKEPGHFRALVLKGATLFDARKFEEAAECFSKAHSLRPDDADILLWRGRCWHRLGRLRHSLADFEAADALEPGRARTLANCGAIRARLRDWPGATRDLEEAVRLNPALSGPLYNLACVQAMTGDARAALEYFRRAIAAGWRNAELARKDPMLEALRRHARLGREFAAMLEATESGAVGEEV